MGCRAAQAAVAASAFAAALATVASAPLGLRSLSRRLGRKESSADADVAFEWGTESREYKGCVVTDSGDLHIDPSAVEPVATVAGDDNCEAVQLPFAVPYKGEDHSTVYVSTAGYLSFKGCDVGVKETAFIIRMLDAADAADGALPVEVGVGRFAGNKNAVVITFTTVQTRAYEMPRSAQLSVYQGHLMVTSYTGGSKGEGEDTAAAAAALELPHCGADSLEKLPRAEERVPAAMAAEAPRPRKISSNSGDGRSPSPAAGTHFASAARAGMSVGAVLSVTSLLLGLAYVVASVISRRS